MEKKKNSKSNVTQMQIGKYISILHRQEQKYMTTLMKQYDLSAPSYSFLSYLNHNEGITQRELCSVIVVNDALASRTMNDLEKQGYIIRKRCEDNARSYELYLTDKARELIPEIIERYESWWSKAMEAIASEEQVVLTKQLQTMAEKVIAEKK